MDANFNPKKCKLQLLISKEEINEAIEKIAVELNEKYAGKAVTLLVVLKGGFCFAADLMRALDFDCRIEVISTSSYGMRGAARAPVAIIEHKKLDLSGKHVLIVDDIFDSGETMRALMNQISEMDTASLASIVLLKQKGEAKDAPDYSLFDLELPFIVGYGLDYKEWGRHFPDLYSVEVT